MQKLTNPIMPITSNAPNEELWRMNEGSSRGEIRKCVGVVDDGKGVTDDNKGLEKKTSRQRRLHQNDALKKLATLRSCGVTMDLVQSLVEEKRGWRNVFCSICILGRKMEVNMKF